MNKIFINHGTFKLGEYELKRGTLTIGRSTSNDIQIDDPSVSNHHAKIVTLFETTFIEDLKSTNGTFVNGKPIQKHTLRSSDIINLGKHQILYHSAPQPQTVAAGGEDNTMILNTANDAASNAKSSIISAGAKTENSVDKNPVANPASARTQHPRSGTISQASPTAAFAKQTTSGKNKITPNEPSPTGTPFHKPDVDLSAYRQAKLSAARVNNAVTPVAKRPSEIKPVSQDLNLPPLANHSAAVADAAPAPTLDYRQPSAFFSEQGAEQDAGQHPEQGVAQTPSAVQYSAQRANSSLSQGSHQTTDKTLDEQLEQNPKQHNLEQNQAQLRARQLWNDREKSAPLNKDAILKQIIYKDNEFSTNLLNANWLRLLAGVGIAVFALTLFLAYR